MKTDKLSAIPWPKSWLLADAQHDIITHGLTITRMCMFCNKIELYCYYQINNNTVCSKCFDNKYNYKYTNT